MKKLRKCRVTLFLLIGWGVLSVLGYLEKDDLYKNYRLDNKTTPYFTLVLQGVHDGIYPWSQEKDNFWEEWDSAENGAEQISEGGSEGKEPSVEYATESLGTEAETEVVETIREKEFSQVDESYFDDAVFIGDSRTVGLHDYGGLDKATFYATVGLNVYDMWNEKFCEVDGKKVTLEEALSAKQFKKVYFQIGINEMGRGTLDSFIRAYEQSVQKFQELQPDAIIFVQGIMRVTKEKSKGDAIFNNPGINSRNERIAALADNQKIFYIDVNDVVCDDEGNLRDDLTFDNLHLYGSKYDIWVDFLMKKGIQ